MDTTANTPLNYESERVLSALLDLSEAMLECGADVNLVEDYLERIGYKYGASRMNVFVITSSIVVTMTRDGRDVTQTRRVINEVSNDFSRLEKLNSLARACLQDPMAPENLVNGVRQLIHSTTPFLQTCVAGVVGAGSLAVFFGGNLMDGVVAALLAVLINFAQRKLSRFCPNLIAFNFIIAAVVGLITLGICEVVSGLNMDKILIGDIMLLIPGIVLTNSMRDMLSGDTLAGLLRFIESLIWTSSLALGYASALLLVNEQAKSIIDVAVNNCPPELQMALAAVSSAAFALFFNANKRYVLPAAFGGFLSWTIYLQVASVGSVFAAVLAASVFSAVYARILAVVTKAPMATFFILTEVPLIPGGALYYTASSIAWRQAASFTHFASLTCQFVLGISFGIGIVWMAVKIYRRIIGRDVTHTLADSLYE